MTNAEKEITGQIVVAWLNSMPDHATAVRKELAGDDAQKIGKFIGEVYEPVGKAVARND